MRYFNTVQGKVTIDMTKSELYRIIRKLNDGILSLNKELDKACEELEKKDIELGNYIEDYRTKDFDDWLEYLEGRYEE